jgi:hypothetical protein
LWNYDESQVPSRIDETGILPQFTGTLMRDGFSSSKWYEQCRQRLCHAHLLPHLVFVEAATLSRNSGLSRSQISGPLASKGSSLLCSLERLLNGKPLVFHQPAEEAD